MGLEAITGRARDALHIRRKQIIKRPPIEDAALLAAVGEQFRTVGVKVDIGIDAVRSVAVTASVQKRVKFDAEVRRLRGVIKLGIPDSVEQAKAAEDARMIVVFNRHLLAIKHDMAINGVRSTDPAEFHELAERAR